MNYLRFLVLGLAFDLGGCSGVVNIQADDSTHFEQIELSYPLGSSAMYRLRLRMAKAEGEFTQSVLAGDRIQIEGVTIPGPSSVNGAADLKYASLAIGADSARTEYEAGATRVYSYIGIARTRFDLTLSDASTTYFFDDASTELYFQYGLSHAFTDKVSAGFAWAGSFRPSSSTTSETDLSVDFKVLRELQLVGGYRWLDHHNQENDDDSAVEIDFDGPFIAISIPL